MLRYKTVKIFNTSKTLVRNQEKLTNCLKGQWLNKLKKEKSCKVLDRRATLPSVLEENDLIPRLRRSKRLRSKVTTDPECSSGMLFQLIKGTRSTIHSVWPSSHKCYPKLTMEMTPVILTTL